MCVEGLGAEKHDSWDWDWRAGANKKQDMEGYRSARIRAMPNGYFKSHHHPGIKLVSTKLQLTANATICDCHERTFCYVGISSAGPRSSCVLVSVTARQISITPDSN